MHQYETAESDVKRIPTPLPVNAENRELQTCVRKLRKTRPIERDCPQVERQTNERFGVDREPVPALSENL